MVYLVGGEKGGVGKTTTAINFAIYLSQEKDRDVLFVDADAQASAAEFMGWRAEHTQAMAALRSIAPEISSLSRCLWI